MAGVKRERGRGNLGARGRKISRPNSLPLPFRTPPKQANRGGKSGLCREVAVSGGSTVYSTVKERRQFSFQIPLFSSDMVGAAKNANTNTRVLPKRARTLKGFEAFRNAKCRRRNSKWKTSNEDCECGWNLLEQ